MVEGQELLSLLAITVHLFKWLHIKFELIGLLINASQHCLKKITNISLSAVMRFLPLKDPRSQGHVGNTWGECFFLQHGGEVRC